MVAVGIGAVLILSAVTLLAPVLKSTKNSNQNQAGAALGKELLDNVNTFAQGNWQGIATLATSSANRYYLNTTSSPFTVTTGTQQITLSSTTYSRFFYVDDVLRDTNGFISATGIVSDPSTKKLTVSYSAPQLATQTLSTYLTRSRSLIYQQSDWSGGSGQDGPLSAVNSKFSTSSNIDYATTTGSLRLQGI
jgi:hypothetical protein